MTTVLHDLKRELDLTHRMVERGDPGAALSHHDNALRCLDHIEKMLDLEERLRAVMGKDVSDLRCNTITLKTARHALADLNEDIKLQINLRLMLWHAMNEPIYA